MGDGLWEEEFSDKLWVISDEQGAERRFSDKLWVMSDEQGAERRFRGCTFGATGRFAGVFLKQEYARAELQK